MQLTGGARVPVPSQVLERSRVEVEDGSLVVDLRRREVQRVTQAAVHREPRRDPPVVLDEVLLEMRAVADAVVLQIDRELLDLTEKKAREGVPVFAVPGRSVKRLLKVNAPVGDGGWMTLRRSQRRSAPALMVWRPFTHVSVSAICVTLVLKSVAVFGGDPSCW